jgi:FKBP-type peptidyl-prolyl cis-trans isomerase
MFRFTAIALTLAALAASPAFGSETTAAETAKSDAATTAAAAEAPKTRTLPSGTKIEDLVVGTGAEAAPGSTVKVHYRGTLTDGKEFDSSLKPGRTPFVVRDLGNAPVIKGWNEGIVGMKVGGKRRLTIPPAAGYGDSGFPPVIPPGATLVFEVELLEVQ